MNFFENAGLAQFDHRIGAYAVALSALALWIAGWRANISGLVRMSANALIGIVTFQIVLGIVTLLNQAPLLLAALHQATAVALLSVALWHAYELCRADAVQSAPAFSA